ncbi:MAG: hypothetical protein DWQ05_17115 [Calditrichaeota bacterium]|nr:MAG: hypothetical protein DWQ05_17115 [Calditrichota bacterium]
MQRSPAQAVVETAVLISTTIVEGFSVHKSTCFFNRAKIIKVCDRHHIGMKMGISLEEKLCTPRVRRPG